MGLLLLNLQRKQFADVATDDIFLHSLSNGFLQYIETALAMLEDKITRLGTGYTHYWYISAAYGLVQSNISQGNPAMQKQQAVDRLSRQYYKILAAQEDLSKAKENMLRRMGNVEESHWSILLVMQLIP